VVVGILRDPSGEEQPAPTVFLPYTTTLSVSTPMLYVRTRHAGPLRSANVIRAVVLAAGRLQPRFNMALFGALAAIALALAAAGVYAVL
jgi:hypothetical protein